MEATILPNILPPGQGMTLPWILSGIEYSLDQKLQEKPVDGICVQSFHNDSRLVQPGDLFVAVAGASADGHRFVSAAIEKGAAAVVVERGKYTESEHAGWSCPVIVVDDSHLAYAIVSANYYGRPADSLKLIGITGTNGKTTITYLLENVLAALGCSVGVIGTVNYRFNANGKKIILPATHTTPAAKELQHLLFVMKEHGVTHVVMEVSSHALSQKRIGQLVYDIAAFTNLSHDHLDYHQSMEDYFQAKTQLFFKHLQPDGAAVISSPINIHSTKDWSSRLAALCKQHNIRTICCGSEKESDLRLINAFSDIEHSEITMNYHGIEVTTTSRLVGHYNIDNLLTACGVLLAGGFSFNAIVPALKNADGAPGRLERVEGDTYSGSLQPVVFVDYAHTPDAVQQVLSTLSSLPHSDLVCVFGCGGDRDTTKRPVMGKIAVASSHVVIATSDNPRREDPKAILTEIAAGMRAAGGIQQTAEWLKSRRAGEKGYVILEDRAQAIRQAIVSAKAGDIVAILGKGHENYQITRQGKRFFDDRHQAQLTLTGWRLDTVVQATRGNVFQKGDDQFFSSVSTDSRTLQPGDIFVAIKGERFDGHDHLPQAIAQGALCCVVEKGRGVSGTNATIVEVDDTLRALGDLARYRRRQIAALGKFPLVAITGSCGKTTVKEMVSSILKQTWRIDYAPGAEPVLHTRGNLNNLIGLPLSLLPLTPMHKAAVLEMGMNAFSEIAQMAQVAEPDISCITNVHGVHLEGLGSIEGVAKAKEELFAGTPEQGTLIVNLDDPHIEAMAERYSHNKVFFAVQPRKTGRKPDFWASDIQPDAFSLSFILHSGDTQAKVTLNALGEHNIANAVASAATASAAGASLEDIVSGLAQFQPADKRMVTAKTAQGLTILNDTYNANPASMKAALAALAQVAGSNKKIAVLGDMLELGAFAAKAHSELGRQAYLAGLDYLAVVGQYASLVQQGAVTAGMDANRTCLCPDKNAACEWIRHLVHGHSIAADDCILVKASRGLKMETLVECLLCK